MKQDVKSRIAGQYYFLNNIYFQGYKKILLFTFHENIQFHYIMRQPWKIKNPPLFSYLSGVTYLLTFANGAWFFPYYHLTVPALNKITYTMQLSMKPPVY